METTTNFKLKKPAQSDTVAAAHQAMNDNMDTLDTLPVPIQSGKNSQLTYQKYADGVLHVWGCINHGSAYPCNQEVASATGYMSSQLTVNFPTSFVDTNYSVNMTVWSNGYWDTSAYLATKANGSLKMVYACALDDSTASTWKILSIDMWGRWK